MRKCRVNCGAGSGRKWPLPPSHFRSAGAIGSRGTGSRVVPRTVWRQCRTAWTAGRTLSWKNRRYCFRFVDVRDHQEPQACGDICARLRHNRSRRRRWPGRGWRHRRTCSAPPEAARGCATAARTAPTTWRHFRSPSPMQIVQVTTLFKMAAKKIDTKKSEPKKMTQFGDCKQFSKQFTYFTELLNC